VLCSLYPAIAYACQQGLRSRRDAVSMFLAVPQRDRDKPHAFEHIGQFGASLVFGGGAGGGLGGGGGAQSHHSGQPRSVRLSANGGAGSQHSSRSGHSSARSASDGSGNANGHGQAKASSLKAATGAASAALSATGSRAPSAGGGSTAGTSRRAGGMGASSTVGANGRVMTAGGSTIGADGVRVLAMTEANLNPQAAQAAAAAQTLFVDATAQLKRQLAQRELDRFGREQRRAKRLEAIGAELEAAQHAH
jgi:hypothetical protein